MRRACSIAIAVPKALGKCEAMVEVCGSTHSGLEPQTLWRPPDAGSSFDAANDNAESITGSIPGSLRKRSAMKPPRSEEHTSELQSLMRISYAVFCLKKKKKNTQ